MDYRIIRTARRTLALEIKKDGEILVRAPLAAPLLDIERFVEEHVLWIEKHRALRDEGWCYKAR